jgi:hypothetical protein
MMGLFPSSWQSKSHHASDPMPVFDEFDDPALEEGGRPAVIQRLDNLMADPVRREFSDPDVVAYTDRQRDRLTDANGAPIRSDFEPFRPAVQRSDIRLESSVGSGEANHPLAVFNTKKLLNKTGFHEFQPGIEGMGEASPRFLADLRRFQAAHDLAPDATAQPGGPTVHMLTRKVFGTADGPPPESESEHFAERFAKDPNRTLSGQLIFGGPDATFIEASAKDEFGGRERQSDQPFQPPQSIQQAEAKSKTSQDDAAAREREEERKAIEAARAEAKQREVTVAMTREMGIDPKLAFGVDRKTLFVIAGIYGYRHLNKRQQYALNRELEKLKRTNTPLYTALTTYRADILVQPYWRIASLSDSELRRAITENRRLANYMDVFSTLPAEAGAAVGPMVAVGGTAIVIGGVAGTGIMLAIKYSATKRAEQMQKLLDQRRHRQAR